MRIGIQLLSLRPGQVGGQGVFIRRLLTHVPSLLDDDRLVIFLRPELAEEAAFSALADDPRIELIVETPERQYGDGYANWNLRLLAGARLQCVFFPLSFFFPRPLPLPVALHVPDIQHEFFPEYFAPDQLAWRRERIPESVRLADAVITFSHCSAESLRERMDAEVRRLHVIPAGGFPETELIDCAAASEAPLSAGVQQAGYILYPAADWPHKNHETLLKAMTLLTERGRTTRLVLTGMLSQRGAVLRDLARRLGITERVHFLGSVSPSTLIWLYRHAAALAFPSRFEGFGLPLVEAMQLGCPVVASTAAGVAETVGSAAVSCEDDPAAWAEKLESVVHDAGLRTRLIRRGRARAAWFDWRRCAAEHLAVLRGIAVGEGGISSYAGAGANCV